jgi:hypothetical protein
VSSHRIRSVVVLREEAVMRGAHEANPVGSMVAPEAEGMAVVELQPVALGAAPALLVDVAASHPVALGDEALDGRRDVS